jgi:hypothetical protein
MALGVHWSFKAPEGIYSFQLFEFHPATGGHANDFCELRCTYTTSHGEQIKQEITDLVSQFPFAFCMMKEEGNAQSIIIGGYYLFDYDFLFGLKIEKVLLKYHVTKAERRISWSEGIIRYKGALTHYFEFYSFKTKEIQYVSSYSKPHLFNASTLSVSFQLFFESSFETEFLLNMKLIAGKQNFENFFVYHRKYEGKTYCAVVATNGRQGLNLQPYRWNDLESYEEDILRIVKKFNCTWGINSTSYDDYLKKTPHGEGSDLTIMAGNPDLC